jgi:hypothetical protein
MTYIIRGNAEVEVGFGLPRHTTVSRTAYTPPAVGYQVFDTDLVAVFTWDGSAWIQAAAGTTSYSKVESDGVAGAAGAKTDKVAGSTAGNFAGLDAAGNLTDSGASAATFATAAQGTAADTAVQPGDNVSDLANDAGYLTTATGDARYYTEVELDAGQLDNRYYTETEADSLFVDVAGDTMTGDLAMGGNEITGLPAVPSATGAASKEYVDAQVGGIDTLGELNDVVITLADAGDFLRFDGTNWVDTPIVAADIPDISATYGTFAQGALADTAVQPGDATSLLTNNDAFVDLTTAQTIAGEKTFTLLTGETTEFSKSAAGNVVKISSTTGSQELLVLEGFSPQIGFTSLSGDSVSVVGVVGDDRLELNYTGAGVGATNLALYGDDIVFSGGVDVRNTHLTTGASVDSTLTTKSYVDAAITSGATLAIDDLTDVDTTSSAPISGEALFYNGTNWVNRSVVVADITDIATTYATFAQGALADTAVQPGDATSLLTNNDAFVDLTTAQNIGGVKTFNDDVNFSSDVVVAGNLVVSGTTTTVNSTNTDIADSIIALNVGETGAGVTTPNQAGLEIKRGTESDAFMIWNEATDSFGQAYEDGVTEGVVDIATFKAFALAEDVAASSYQTSFNTGDWIAGTPSTFLVSALTHGIAYTAGDVFMVQVYESAGGVASLTTVDTVIDETTGDVTIQTVGAVFNGSIVIAKA